MCSIDETEGRTELSMLGPCIPTGNISYYAHFFGSCRAPSILLALLHCTREKQGRTLLYMSKFLEQSDYWKKIRWYESKR